MMTYQKLYNQGWRYLVVSAHYLEQPCEREIISRHTTVQGAIDNVAKGYQGYGARRVLALDEMIMNEQYAEYL